jgi:type IV pilus assembly protein PilX
MRIFKISKLSVLRPFLLERAGGTAAWMQEAGQRMDDKPLLRLLHLLHPVLQRLPRRITSSIYIPPHPDLNGADSIPAAALPPSLAVVPQGRRGRYLCPEGGGGVRDPLKSQSGVVLVVSLIMLLLLTIIGISGMQSTVLEERMAGNMRDRNLAFQAAEAGLRDAEAYLNSNTGPFNPLKEAGGPFQIAFAPLPLCKDGLCPQPNLTPPRWAGFTDAEWQARGLKYGAKMGAADIVGVAFPPRYFIELIGTCVPATSNVGQCLAPFRVTVRAWGANATTVVQLQVLHRIQVLSFVK